MRKVTVIGGGAAGMMAAVQAAGCGAEVLLLEQNEKLGKKVYITGKGRCNVTNQCTAEDFRRNVVKNPRFLYSALEQFAPADMMNWLENHGCPVTVERGNRVFPQSMKASDVTRAFEKELQHLRVDVRLHTCVEKIVTADGTVTGVQTSRGFIPSDAVIIATGGQSYTSTGSTGDGWHWLSELGHTVYPAMPSLVGLCSPASWVTDLQGLSLKNVRLTLRFGKKTLYTEIGEMLFTHFGISGPMALSASAYLTEHDPDDVRLLLDLKPGLDEAKLDARILRDIAEAPKKQMISLACGLFPAHLAEKMLALCEIIATDKCCDLRSEQRSRLIAAIKALPVPISGLRSLEEAIVTRGGLSVKEVDPATMQSKRVRGLYIAGEMLDVDALTGGFNLHIAFSTGYVAGQSAAK